MPLSEWWDCQTLFDLMVRCASDLPKEAVKLGCPDQYDLACALVGEVDAVYMGYWGAPASCPLTPPPSPQQVAAAVAAKHGGELGSSIESAAMMFAQIRYPLAQTGFAIQQITCAETLSKVPPPPGLPPAPPVKPPSWPPAPPVKPPAPPAKPPPTPLPKPAAADSGPWGPALLVGAGLWLVTRR